MTLALLGVVLLALLVPVGYLADKTYAADTRRADIASVQTVARRVVTNFYSIGYQNFDQDAQRVYADMSDKFKAQAVQQLGTTWKQTVVNNKLISSAAVSASGVIDIQSKSAEVMVTVRRTAQSAQVTTPASTWQSAQVQLTKIGGHWRVSGMGGLQ
ncbi:hypothetical protein GCM10023195_23100 [Actinoallomurus liliacearum]|uniref:Mce-associated membrane protein n=1 Tax=Actinoallomurus liliacearum TaxID=1080073 RepID=A0ABP8THL1_9ACTN